ncbi:hypothetical protein BLNAU_24049 [Blattamonas nauphoetae]|uniref:Uncharacterized protein n=1 Tax=Blattamonas nauphoetae TaxID=2049346 RepID=A0ABQ9WNI3_9EUKA|nr:hypothetical protein BLNAU_24049 [Blattamonas nauphoetae]
MGLDHQKDISDGIFSGMGSFGWEDGWHVTNLWRGGFQHLCITLSLLSFLLRAARPLISTSDNEVKRYKGTWYVEGGAENGTVGVVGISSIPGQRESE